MNKRENVSQFVQITARPRFVWREVAANIRGSQLGHKRPQYQLYSLKSSRISACLLSQTPACNSCGTQ
ncbi:hypothetical protein J6590_094868 [Homalodisca vitripennis]|nr:hypothetical protein J6590_094868 [Homalodisca vitripennis]